jgi:hypothetical protein
MSKRHRGFIENYRPDRPLIREPAPVSRRRLQQACRMWSEKLTAMRGAPTRR